MRNQKIQDPPASLSDWVSGEERRKRVRSEKINILRGEGREGGNEDVDEILQHFCHFNEQEVSYR